MGDGDDKGDAKGAAAAADDDEAPPLGMDVSGAVVSDGSRCLGGGGAGPAGGGGVPTHMVVAYGKRPLAGAATGGVGCC